VNLLSLVFYACTPLLVKLPEDPIDKDAPCYTLLPTQAGPINLGPSQAVEILNGSAE